MGRPEIESSRNRTSRTACPARLNSSAKERASARWIQASGCGRQDSRRTVTFKDTSGEKTLPPRGFRDCRWRTHAQAGWQGFSELQEKGSNSLLVIFKRLRLRRSRTLIRLETIWLCEAEPTIDAVARESTQIVFRLYAGVETSLAAERDIVSVIKVYLTFPGPTVCVWIFPNYPNEGLVAVRILYLVS